MIARHTEEMKELAKQMKETEGKKLSTLEAEN